MRLVAVIVIALLSAAPALAQIGPGTTRQEVKTTGWTFYVVGCVHFTSPVGGGNPARLRFSKFIREVVNPDSSCSFLALVGDHQFDHVLNEDNLGYEQWLVSLLTDTLDAAIDPLLITGNHENTRLESGDFSADGTLFNRFIQQTQHKLFRPWESAAHPGRRFACFQPDDRLTGQPLNAKIFLANNNDQDTTDVPCYEVNNPDGYGYADDSFDGLRYSDSPQFKDGCACLSGLPSGYWPFVFQHRSARRLVTGVPTGPEARPSYPEMEVQGGWLDSLQTLVGRTLLVFEQDQHMNAMWGPVDGRWHIAATGALRGGDPDSIAAMGSALRYFAFSDTVGGSSVAVDSLGADHDLQPDYPGTLFPSHGHVVKGTVSGSTVTIEYLLIQNEDATATLKTQEIELNQ